LTAASNELRQFGADGLTDTDRRIILDAIARYPEIERVTLFGSRAMGTFGQGSDIDLALEGGHLQRATLARLAAELEESDLPYKVDLLLRNEHLDTAVEEHIQRHGYPFGWRRSTWGDEISLEYGKGLRGYSDAKGPVRVFGTSGPVGWTDTALAEGPGVILGRKGAYRGIHYSSEPFFVIDTAYYAVPKTNLNMRWLYYAMIYHELGKIDDGSPIPSTTRAAVYPRELVVPPSEQQDAIVDVLGTLDDKIEQNRRTSRALERLARAIFRAWFVDFEPVDAKAAGATSFPSMPQDVFDALPTTFTPSELGPIPEGWSVGVVADLIALSKTQVKPQNFAEELFEHFSLPAYDNGLSPSSELGHTIKSNKFLVVSDSILISKLNPRIPRVWLPCTANQHRQIASTEFIVCAPKIGSDRSYVYCLFLQPEFRDEFAQVASGTSTSHQRVRPDDFLSAQVVLPPDVTRKMFSSVVTPLFAHVEKMRAELLKLAEVRGYLLPKLLSGEVRVGNADDVLAEVSA
jgi:type I restriction enzyme, S subunit